MSAAKEYSEEDENRLIEIVIPMELAQNLASGQLNVDTICRVCLTKNENMIPMFSENVPQVADTFTLFSSIQLFSDDGLPPHICERCKEQLNNCYEFKQQCEKSDIILKTVIKGEFVTNIELLPKREIVETEEDRVPFFQGSIYDKLKADKDVLGMLNVIKNESDSDDKVLCFEEDVTPDSVRSKRSTSIRGSKHLKSKNKLETIIEERLDEQFASLDCDVCGQNFTDPTDFLDHLKSHDCVTTHACSFCSKEFSKVKSLKRHIQIKHQFSSTKGVPCGYCNETFTSQGDLQIHNSVHTDNGRKCNKCHKEYTTRHQLKRHIRRHMEEKKYKCEVCSKQFTELCALMRHRAVHTGEAKEKKHECNVCNKRFSERSALRDHLLAHSGERPCVCSQCGKTFRSTRLLRSHMLTHNDHKPYKCIYCDKRFRHESTRNTHHRTHTGERPYICSVCGKAFIQGSNLSLHMRTHSGEKPYKCKTCDRNFGALSTLKAHERMHSGEKPYGCNICGQRFARMNLRRHMLRHSGDKPHTCSICPKKFISASRLREHSRMHTGERPYECNTCNQKYATKSHVIKHIKTHEAKTITCDAKTMLINKNIITLNDNLQSSNIKCNIGNNKNNNDAEDDIDRFIISQDNIDETHEVTVEFVPDMEVTGELELQDGEDSKTGLVLIEQDQRVIEVYSHSVKS